MDHKPHTHCHFCGKSLEEAIAFDGGLKCSLCKNTNWVNPTPVAVLIAHCGYSEYRDQHAVFAVRRGIEPFKGQLALPSGFIVSGESWQEAAVREANEEIGLHCRVNSPLECPEHVLTESTPDKKIVLIVGHVQGVFYIEDPFVPNREALERVILTPDVSEQLCFPIHRKALAMYWDERGVKHNIVV